MKREGHQIATLYTVIASGWVKNWRVAVDAGAYDGAWSAVLAGHFDKVIAFEPSPRNYERAAATLAPFDNALVFREGLLDTAAEVGIDNTSKAEKACGDFLVPGRTGARCIPLDSVRLPHLDLLKLDVEGAEYPALIGARYTIEQCRPVIIMEISRHAKRFGRTDRDAVDLLTKWRYRVAMSKMPDVVFVP